MGNSSEEESASNEDGNSADSGNSEDSEGSVDSDDVAEFVSDSGSDSNGDGDSDSSDIEGAENSESMDASDEEEDDCEGISADDCNEQYDVAGNQLCAQNIQTEECYEVVQSRGEYGRGGFDSGYNAATATAEAEKEDLNVIIGVLGGIIAVLVIVVAAGGYFVYSTQNQKRTHFGHDSLEVEMGDAEAGDAQRMDDKSPMITNH